MTAALALVVVLLGLWVRFLLRRLRQVRAAHDRTAFRLSESEGRLRYYRDMEGEKDG